MANEFTGKNAAGDTIYMKPASGDGLAAPTAYVAARGVLDGHDVAAGATTDNAVVSDTSGTRNGFLRGLVKIFADVWNSSSHFLKVSLATTLNITDDAIKTYPVLSGVVRSDGTVLTPLNAIVSVSSSGDNTFIAAPGAGSYIYVLGYSLQAQGTTTAQLQGSTGTSGNVSQSWSFQAREGVSIQAPPGRYLFKLGDNERLDLNLGSAVTVTGQVWYVVNNA